MSEQAVMDRLPGGIYQYSHSQGGEEHKPEQHADYRRPAATLTHFQPLQTEQGVESLG
ncbi:hypothetical protein ABQ345_09380 [Serratia fonticola]|uniref:hypothetical protein n=1 Tax=Serratia fonticola TaxID=47917 RepID=UPI003AAA3C94